ncbi:MAG: SAM-dependent methyltransferase [Janthinobacterium lividum]
MLIQMLALFFVLCGARALVVLAGVGVGLLPLAFVQGLLAALLSRKRLASWWLPIQLLFAPALLVASMLALEVRLPPVVFLLVFLLMLALFWTTFRTQVPYYPSREATWDSVAALLPMKTLRIIDIGSGFGGFTLALARRRPDCQVDGIEVAPLPWAVSSMRAWILRARHGSRARFLRGDYYRLDFSAYDTVFAYLSPAAMPALWSKARAEMKPGSLLLSCEFVIPQVPADIVIEHEGGVPALYGWRM